MATALTGPVRAENPFDPDNEAGYRRWREAKLARAPASLAALIVEIRDPGAITDAEHEAMLARCRAANMVVYASERADADKEIPQRLGARFGLVRLDRNWLADEDGVSQVTVADAAAAGRGEYIPYTNRSIRWHTDGYYNPPGREIRAMLLHCVSRAWEGGSNRLLDHELAYLMLPDAMTIPARLDDNRVARAAQAGPVFSVDREHGALHMRYTARTRSIEWKQEPAVQAALAALERLLAAASPHIHQVTLAPGMGVLCNNVLHDRTGFVDDPDRPRLLYRARYRDRVQGT